MVDAVGPGGGALAIKDVAHRGEVVLILQAVPPERPAIGKREMRPGDPAREQRNGLVVAQHGERHIQRAGHPSHDQILHAREAVFIPQDLFDQAFLKRPTIHHEPLAHHCERPRQFQRFGGERRVVIVAGNLLQTQLAGHELPLQLDQRLPAGQVGRRMDARGRQQPVQLGEIERVGNAHKHLQGPVEIKPGVEGAGILEQKIQCHRPGQFAQIIRRPIAIGPHRGAGVAKICPRTPHHGAKVVG